MDKKDKILRSIHCKECGNKSHLIYFGNRKRKNSEPQQLIQCTECNRIYLLEEEPFKGQHSSKDKLFKMLKALAQGQSIRAIAKESGVFPGAVQRTKAKTEKFISKKLNDIQAKTGLTPHDIVTLIQRKWDRDKTTDLPK